MLKKTIRISNPTRFHCLGVGVDVDVDVSRQLRQRIALILFGMCFVILTLTYTYQAQTQTTSYNYRYLNTSFAGNFGRTLTPNHRQTEYVPVPGSPDNSSCHLPRLIPFHDSVLRYVEPAMEVDCEKNFNLPVIFSTDLHSNLIQEKDPANFQLLHCCYKVFERETEENVTFLEDCHPIRKKITPIPFQHEFIAVYCLNSSSLLQIPVDMFNFVHVHGQHQKLPPAQHRLNVAILGLDSISHMNFLRTMPCTFGYLSQNLSAFGMAGYTKVDDNTFPNLIPALTGRSVGQISESCWQNRSYFDGCAFIWDEYAAAGYQTSFAEEESWMGIFNYVMDGFRDAPTDFYFRPFAETLRAELGHTAVGNTKLCAGPKLTVGSLLENMKKVAHASRERNKNFFQFAWSSSVSHDDMNLPSIADGPVADHLRWFHDQRYLENTVYVLMSDHGLRYGGILDTAQGRIEERMPFLYFVFPAAFQEKRGHANAFENLRANRARLTTPYDLYETFKDVLNVGRIQNEQIQSRQADLLGTGAMPRGISLFLPIPAERTCESAGILKHWCVCHSKATSVPVNDAQVASAASAMVAGLNKMLAEYPTCAQLSLDSIVSAQALESESDEIDDARRRRRQLQMTTLRVRFKTKPGLAIFEGTVVQEEEAVGRADGWTLDGDVSRNNKYGNQSQCVRKRSLKKYCFCL